MDESEAEVEVARLVGGGAQAGHAQQHEDDGGAAVRDRPGEEGRPFAHLRGLGDEGSRPERGSSDDGQQGRYQGDGHDESGQHRQRERGPEPAEER